MATEEPQGRVEQSDCLCRVVGLNSNATAETEPAGAVAFARSIEWFSDLKGLIKLPRREGCLGSHKSELLFPLRSGDRGRKKLRERYA